MDKSYLGGPDDFVSPYLRRRLRPLAEVLQGEERPGPRAAPLEAGSTPNGGLDRLAATATSPSENERNGQNCAE